jgi:succinate dehydrogenase / fumarate reductase cytochrome b subunit
MGWGVVSSRRALARLEWLALTLFVLLLAMSWAAIYALWAAGAPA